MTLLDVKRDPVTGHYDLHMRATEVEALDLARRIIACAEEKTPPKETSREETSREE